MADKVKNDGSALKALIGWGALTLFVVGFAWVVISQLQDTEEWSSRGKEAVDLVRGFKPDGQPDTLEDLLKGYSLKAKEKGSYVGEFSWNSTQKDGPEYEVSLLWKEGNNHRTALWRVDLEQQAVRPQGDAASLPQRARDGTVGG
ncbi:MAG: hypothetical protein ABI629_00520 [bacterium]